MADSAAVMMERLANERLATRASIEEQRRAEESRLAVLGLGRSGAIVENLTKIDALGVADLITNMLRAIIPTLSKVSDVEALNHWSGTAERELESLTKTEFAWVRERAAVLAARIPIPPSQAEPIVAAEEARCSNHWRQRLDAAVSKRQLELKPVYFPDIPPTIFSQQSVFDIDAAELGSDSDAEELAEAMYESSDALFHLFTKSDEALPIPVGNAQRLGTIRVIKSETGFYRHPRFQASWVRITSPTPNYDWEKDLLVNGVQYHRHSLDLTPRARAEMAASRAADGPTLASALPYIWVLEDLENTRQGTAFSLSGKGTITCNHVVLGNIVAHRPGDPDYRKVKVLQRGPLADLALVEVERSNPNELVASTIEPSIGDRVWIAGFPNYQRGDSGVIYTGLVSGTRVADGIRRLLVSAPIVAGMSGSPVLNNRGEVVGVAATGADRMESAPDTEKHSVIPLSALADMV